MIKTSVVRLVLLLPLLALVAVATYWSLGAVYAAALVSAIALLLFAAVARPLVLEAGARNRRSFLVPILVAASLAFAAFSAAVTNTPIMVVASVVALMGLIVVLSRSAAARGGR